MDELIQLGGNASMDSLGRWQSAEVGEGGAFYLGGEPIEIDYEERQVETEPELLAKDPEEKQVLEAHGAGTYEAGVNGVLEEAHGISSQHQPEPNAQPEAQPQQQQKGKSGSNSSLRKSDPNVPLRKARAVPLPTSKPLPRVSAKTILPVTMFKSYHNMLT